MANRVWGVALVVAVISGCGGSGPAPSPSPTPTEPPPPSSPPPATSNPPPTTPQPDPPEVGTPPTSATPPTNGDPPPTDTPPPSATTSAACAGLLPAAPGAGVAYALPAPPPGNACDQAVTDGRGAWIGVGYVTPDGHAWRFVDAKAPGAATGGLALPLEVGRSLLAPQPDGYHALSADVPGSLRRLDATGALLSDPGKRDGWSVLPLPGGGSVLVTVEGFGGPAAPVIRVAWVNAAGDRRGEALMPSLGGATPRLAVSATGHVLVVGGGQARWFGPDGAPLTDWFSFTVPSFRGGASRAIQGLSSMPLADGSVVDAINTPFALRFEDGSTRTTAPPDWVISRKGSAGAVVRGGRASAFASVLSKPDEACRVSVEVVTAAGESCGEVKLTAPEPCSGVAFGADGTLFTSAWPRGDGCRWRWWSGLLR